MTDNKYRILLVDDDNSLLRLLSMRLTAAGYDVTAVESGEEALAQLPLLQPSLIITDLQMEGMDGMTLFNQVHSRNPTLPVLILTARGEESDKVLGFRLGADDYVTKPFGVREVIARIRAVLRRGSAEPGSSALAISR